jgi:hypothetical protein
MARKNNSFVNVKLNTKKLDKIARDLFEAAKLEVTVGIQGREAQERYILEDGSPGLTLGEMAIIHEFGIGVPKRPIWKIFNHTKRSRIATIYKQAAKELVLDKRSTPLSVLKRAGDSIALEAEKVFTQSRRWLKPNAASTVAQKGFDYPLHDSLKMANSITWAVRFGGKIKAKGSAING